ncbi:MAG TPA: hypothetical protein DCE41_00985 [Cytophagales bacterium]|nr:hypothetical protein [Cytophagales bacterium]HAA23477.1 hypothetical protein [Cytophagales bacterium]HAP58306.1 hypothetical protein [Cytophagales bacterium]
MKKVLPLLCILVNLGAFAQAPLSVFDSIGQAHAKLRNFSGTILLAQEGQVTYEASFGQADLVIGTPNTLDTQYPIASVTKLFTALVIMQLVEEGKLNLHTPVAQILPAWDISHSEYITPHHLLLHASGLKKESDRTYRKPLTSTEMLSKALSKSYVSTDFEQFRYNNVDYLLLGQVIEEVTGKPWADQVQERILTPLKMGQTGFHQAGNHPEGLVKTYSQSRAGTLKSDPVIYWQNFYAAGNMYSTAQDLLKLHVALGSEQLLSNESKETLYKMHPEWGCPAYSVWTYKYPFVASKPRLMERRGGILGANCVLVRGLEEDFALIILSNNSAFNPDSFGDPTNLREALLMAAFE